jgi:hypothetical protein
MDKDKNLRVSRTVTPSKPSGDDRPPMKTGGWERLGIYLESTQDDQLGVIPRECIRIKDARGLTALPVRDSSGLLSGIVTEALGTVVIFLFVAPLIIASWLSVAWSADVTPAPPPPSGSRPENPQGPTAPPPSRIDPGIERRPQTIPDPRSAVTPPNVDPKMAIDPETAPPAMEKLKPGVSKEPPRNPSPR